MSRVAHVSHPVLHLDVLARDARTSSDHRVFCRYQQRSVPLGACTGCKRRDPAASPSSVTIDCAFPIPDDDPPVDESGDRTSVGALLAHGTAALDPSCSLDEAFGALRRLDRRSIPVVDARHALVGVVHETVFVGKPDAGLSHDHVTEVMSAALALHESVSIHDALRLLASAHLREVTVVDDGRVPLGTFRDVDGLRWVVRARKTLPPPPGDDS